MQDVAVHEWKAFSLGHRLDAVALALLILILAILGSSGIIMRFMVEPVPGNWATHLHERAVSALFALIYLRLGLGLFTGGFGWAWFGWALLLAVAVPVTLIGQAASGLQGHGWFGMAAGGVMARAPGLDGLTSEWISAAFGKPEIWLTRHAVAEGLLLAAGAGVVAANSGRLSSLFAGEVRRQAIWLAVAVLAAGWLLARAMSWPLPLDNPDNAVAFKPLETPGRIVPDWYLSPWFAMMRSAATREGGSIISWASLALPVLASPMVWVRWRSPLRIGAWLAAALACAGFVVLAMIGRQPPEPARIAISVSFTAGFFVYFLLVLPFLGVLDLLWKRRAQGSSMLSSEPRR